MNILVDEVEEKGALAHAGFADDIGVVPSVIHGEEEGVLPSIAMAYSEIDNCIIPHTQANRHSERVEVPLPLPEHRAVATLCVSLATYVFCEPPR
jgi:hypothetical protein